MSRKLAIAGALGVCALAALATLTPIRQAVAGSFENLPLIGGASYCAAYIGAPVGQTTITGTGGGTGSAAICAVPVPAGPTTFSGNETVVMDLYTPGVSSYAGGPQTALTNITQLGQGPMVDLTTVATSQTIPNNTPYYFLDGAQGSALTVTMPAVAVEGQLQRVICEAATVGTLTVAANTGQTLKVNPNTACVAGVGYTWRYQASNTTWYRVN